MFKPAVGLAVVGAFVLGLEEAPAARQQRTSGISNTCGEFEVLVINAGIFGSLAITAPDEGWAYIDPAQKRRQATGIAHDVHMAASDTPANHYSHDLDFKILLDPEQEDLLSPENDDSLPIEWEAGIRPWEKTGDGANPIFPKWAWPSNGDRVWVDGNWIYDCGHPDEDSNLYRAEIHPARALATMRDQAAPLPGTGLTPVPVTLTDLYISGNGGFAPNQLNCGPDIILGPYGSTCGQEDPPADTSYKTTPINDTDFTFFVCLPVRPTLTATLIHRVDNGPGNTVGIDPIVEPVDTAEYCAQSFAYDQGKMLRVTVPLKDTQTPPTAVYARRIYAGWLGTPDPVLPHRRVTLKSTDLHEDHDLDPGDGELTFWWLNVDAGGHLRSDLSDPGAAWLRLSDFAKGNMNDYDDDTGPGDGEMSYAGASFEFYLRYGQQFTVNSTGFEQDCFDNAFDPLPDGFWFTYRRLSLLMYATCYSDFADAGAGDAIGNATVTFAYDDLGDKTINSLGSEYHLRLSIDEVAPGLDDTSALSIQTGCTPSGEVALVGVPLPCETLVHNGGPGLPRQVEIVNTFPGTPSATFDSGAWSLRAPFGSGEPNDCAMESDKAICRPTIIGLVPVAVNAPVKVAMVAKPAAPGLLTARAAVTTASTDPDTDNNVATATIDVFRSVTVDVSPRSDNNEVNLKRGGTVTVAIMTTADFDAASIDPLSVCFGDPDAPAERTCSEQHSTGHLEDVNKDKRPDLLLHYFVDATGLDLGDTSACVIGRTRDGIGVYGCGAVIVQ